MRLEILLDEMVNTLGKVKSDMLEGRSSRLYPTLKQQYMNVLIRTGCIAGINMSEHEMDRKDNPKVVCGKVEGYIKLLQERSIYGLGQEEVKFWKIGPQ